MQEGSLFSTLSPVFIFCRFFDNGHSDQCEVIPYCSFDLRFSNSNFENLAMYILAICMSFLDYFSLWIISKETINKTERQPTEWGKIFAKDEAKRDLFPKYTSSICTSI